MGAPGWAQAGEPPAPVPGLEAPVTPRDLGTLRLRHRLGLAFLLYNAMVVLVYRHWLTANFAYFGFTFLEPGPLDWAKCWFLAMAPVLFIRTDRLRSSTFMLVLLYALVYAPSIWATQFMGLRPPGEVLMFQVHLLAGFLLAQGASWLPLVRLRKWTFPARVPRVLALVLYALALFAVLAAHQFKIQLLDFKAVYELRAQNSLEITTPIIAYLEAWLCFLLHPMILAVGLRRRRPWLITYGVLSEVIMYGLTGFKAALFVVPLVLAVHVLFHAEVKVLATRLVGGLGAAALAMLGLPLIAGDGGLKPFVFAAQSILFMRTIAMGGLLSAQYHSFFLDHPLTRFSHSRIGALFYAFPYAQAIGFEIGDYYTGEPGLNSNAHLFVTDGFSTFGYPGMLLAGALALGVFYAIDAVTDRVDPRTALAMLAFFVVEMSNTSLMTTLLTGGLIFLILLFQCEFADLKAETP
jgi:hypothetical protein